MGAETLIDRSEQRVAGTRRANRRLGGRPVWLVAGALVIAACGGGGDGDEVGESTVVTEPASTSTLPTDTGVTTEQEPPVPAIVSALREAGADPELFSGRGELTTFIAPGFDTANDDPEQAAWSYLEAFAAPYGVSDPSARFELVSVTETSIGTVVRMRQLLGDLPVFAGEITVTVSLDGKVLGVNGVIAPDAEIPDATVSGADAVAAALTATGGRPGDSAELVVFSPAVDATDPAPPIPAWAVPVLVDDEGVWLEELVVVSGIDGTILVRAGIDMTGENWDLSDTANEVDEDGKAVYDNATLIFETRDGDRTQKTEPDGDASGAAGHFSTTWAYWLDTHGRDGFDGAGGTCDIYVHVGVNWKNASSNRNCFMRIGDARLYAQSLDVLAHELTHSVTGRTSGLIYEDQSGALNEHYSDFFATMVDRSDWVIDIVNRDTAAPAIDRFSEFLVTDEDKGGVHDNSGIGNHVGYLVAAEGTKVHADTGVEVTGIGREKTETLWYAVLQSLAPRENYSSWACATINAARQMADFSDDDKEAVVDAMVAVELVEERDDRLVCGYAVSGFSTAPSPSTVPATTPASTTPTTAPSTTVPPTSDPECSLVGTWRLHDQAFWDAIAQLAGPAPGEIEYYSGDYIIEIAADGTSVSERRAWSFRASTPDGSIVIEITSREVGTWQADDHTFSVSDSGNDAEVSFYLETPGGLTPLPFGSGIPTQTEAVSGTGTYTCVGDLLTIDANTEAGSFTTFWDRIA